MNYGEPWSIKPCHQERHGEVVVDCDGAVLESAGQPGSPMSVRVRRELACVNALAGIENPKEWIEEIRADNLKLRAAIMALAERYVGFVRMYNCADGLCPHDDMAGEYCQLSLSQCVHRLVRKRLNLEVK